MLIRRLDPDDDAELNNSVSFAMLTVLETLPEARRDPSVVPGFTFEAMQADYRVKSRRDDRLFLVAEDDQAGIVGHAAMLLAQDDAGRTFGYFATRYVLPRWRRRGLARRFLKRGLAWFRERGVAYAMAHTHESNEPLLGLFRSEGFTASKREGRWPSWELRLEFPPSQSPPQGKGSAGS